jgi:Fe-S cluster assembly protein SufD
MSSATAIALEAPALPDWIQAAVAATGDGPEWLAGRRREGLERFAAAGFPGRRDEDWKYTSLRLVEQRAFSLAAARPLAAPAIAGLDCPALVFVNGRLAARTGLPEGAVVMSLAEALTTGHPACRELLGTLADPARHRFAALATALFADGVLIELAENAVLAEPLRLVFISRREDGPALACPRVLVKAGANSSATLVEHYVAASGEALELAVTELRSARARTWSTIGSRSARRTASTSASWRAAWAATPRWSATTCRSAGGSRASIWTLTWPAPARGLR